MKRLIGIRRAWVSQVPSPLDGEYQIEHFDKTHERIHFSCGEDQLDKYIKQIVSQDFRKWATVPFVMVRPPHKTVIGYYTLSSRHVDIADWPEALKKKLPIYREIPVTLLGRLAVDRDHKGKRLGEYLLMDALHRSWLAAKEVGSVAVIVDSINEAASNFYQHYDFIPFPQNTSRLFLLMQTINEMFA